MSEMIERLVAALRAEAKRQTGGLLDVWHELDGDKASVLVVEGELDLAGLARAAIDAAFQWQPIDSAPKDGTWFLSCDATGHRDIIHWWDFNCPGVWHGRRPDQDPEPVWWMPLPAGPTIQPPPPEAHTA
jgi:hypothetical protein